MSERTRFVGLDAHAATIAVGLGGAVGRGARDHRQRALGGDATGQVGNTTPADPWSWRNRLVVGAARYQVGLEVHIRVGLPVLGVPFCPRPGGAEPTVPPVGAGPPLSYPIPG